MVHTFDCGPDIVRGCCERCRPLSIALIAAAMLYAPGILTCSQAVALSICPAYDPANGNEFFSTPVKIAPRYLGYCECGFSSGAPRRRLQSACRADGSGNAVPLSCRSLTKTTPITLHTLEQQRPVHVS